MNKTSDNFNKYIDEFFNNIELYDDIHNEHKYKKRLKTYVDNFLSNQTTENAKEIYKYFFMIYQIKYEDKSEGSSSSEDGSNTLLNLVEIMGKYEENTGDLIDKQRDHFLHSVNVFLLGLAIYSKNKKYRDYFKKYVRESPYEKYYRIENENSKKENLKKDIKNKPEVSNEEFLYRWGIASLFHDIGYPVEIIGKQMKKFINDGVRSIDNSYNVDTAIDFKDFSRFNTIVKRKSDFTDKFRNDYPESKFLNLFKPTHLMAYKIYEDLKPEEGYLIEENKKLQKIEESNKNKKDCEKEKYVIKDNIELTPLVNNLDNFVTIMKNSGFIDHGFFSSILVLNSYGYLIQKYKRTYDFFFYPIVDSASAILLHNFFRNVLFKDPYNASSLSPEKSPIAFLLILCDELQEWNRKPLGVVDKERNHVADIITDITEDSLYVKYIVKSGPMGSSFLIEKKDLLDKVLDLQKVFKDGLTIKTNVEDDNITMKDITYREARTPNILMTTIDKLPAQIYAYYSEITGDDKELEKIFESLTPSEQYSNMRQAKSISKNLSMIGCEIAFKSDKRDEYILSDNEINDLAMFEHKDWCSEKIEAGWSPGKDKDDKKLIHPLLDDWENLDSSVQEDNKKTIENLVKILSNVDLKVVFNKTRLLSIELHNYYNEVFNSDIPFDSLSDEQKYFNYKQADFIINFLKEHGYNIVFEKDEGIHITEFNPKEIECLAKKEHEKWCDYKRNLGWEEGEKSEEDKTNPNICEWKDLDESTREFNKNTIKKLPDLCSNQDAGLKIIKENPDYPFPCAD
ncbi:RyR domain-containing protein [Methanobrevibacter sp.]|uniref:RyR domain-containing protein n=1 Tax=Methanobrevibacter sp. TaxID=66852 RepID=UPI003890DDBA